MVEYSLKTTHGLLASVCCTLAFSGCAAFSEHVTGMLDSVSIHARQHRELAAIRNDTRSKLAQKQDEVMKTESQRQIEQARIDAEQRQLEAEFCIANQQQQQQRVRDNLKQSIESKVAFNVEHSLEVGELEVDTEALKTLLEKREQAQNQPQEGPPSQNQEEQGEPCKCCDQPCGCRPGLLRRHCPLCFRKPCEAEKDCGGPAKYAQMQQQPQKQPLRPAEIPLKLPVKLSFGMQQPQMEQTKISRKPPPSQEQQEQKGRCPHCRKPKGNCTDNCINRGSSVLGGKGPEGDRLDPPKPEPTPEGNSQASWQRSVNLPAVVPAISKRKVNRFNSNGTSAQLEQPVVKDRVSDQ